MHQEKRSRGAKANALASRIRAFIEHLATVAEEGSALPTEGEAWVSFSHAGLGWVWLTGAEAEEYTRLVADVSALMDDRPSKRRDLRNQVQRAILEALDIRRQRPEVPIRTRIDDALKHLVTELEKPPVPWDVYMPVDGLVGPKRPIRIGGLLFRRVTESLLRRLRGHIPLPETVRNWPKENRAVAHVRLSGFEGKVVNLAATERLAPILDVLNFLGDVTYGPEDSRTLYLPGAGPGGLDERLHLIHNPDPLPSYSFRRLDPRMPFDLADLRKRGSRQLTVRVLNLLARQVPTALERRILVAVQWAGRATAERRAEQKVLLYLISLESLVLGPESASELGYRLRLRVAHLLGRTPTLRAKVSKAVQQVYLLRSRIVHAGALGITVEDVADARAIANAAIVAMTGAKLRRLVTEGDIEAWFQDRALR